MTAPAAMRFSAQFCCGVRGDDDKEAETTPSSVSLLRSNPVVGLQRLFAQKAMDFTVRCYPLVFAFYLTLYLALTGGAVAWGMTRPGGTPFSDQTQYDWNIATVPQSERADALNGAFESIASSKVSARGQPGFRSQVTFMYSWKDGRSASIFTAANLATMCSVESVLLDSPRYNEFCLLPANASAAGCASPTSLVSFQVYAAAGALVQWKTCALLPEATVAAFAAEVVGAIVADASSTTARAKGWMMASDVAARNVSVRARSLLNYGAPLDGFTSEQDRITEQRTQNNKYFNEVKESLFAKLSMLPPGANPNRFVWSFVDRNYYYMRPAFIDDLQVEFWSFWFQNVEFSSLVDSDLTITIVSIIYVIAYMSMHMQSVYLGVVGMIQIMLSLPVSYFIYSCIFQVAFFQQIHILVIFVVLGVGADDIFVLVDAYKQTEGRFKVGDVHEGQRLASREDVLKSRMAEAYERAMKAIFNTSFTTACAFLANVISPVMPISSFGIYAALCIVLNYIIVITWTPAALVIYHKWCECLPFCGCCFCWQLCGICPPVRGQVPDAPCWTAAPDAAAAGVAVEMTTTTTTTSASDAAVVGAREAERGGDNDSIACDGTEDVDIVVLDAPASGGTLEDASEAEVATDDETESDAPLGWRAKFEALLPPSQYSFGTVEWVFDVIYIPLMLGPVVTVPGWCCDSRNAIRSKCIAPEAEEGADNAVIAVEKKKVDGATSTKVEGHRVQLKLFSIFTIILLSIYAIIAATMTFKLTTPEQEEEWFADGHMFNGLRDRRTKNFFSATNTENTKVYLSWGIAGIDRTAGQESGVAFSRWKPGLNRGSVEWDTSFSVSSVAAQQHVLETCTKLEAAPCTAVGCSLGKLVVPGSVVCPLAVLKTWLEVSALRPGQCDPINAGGVCFTSQAAVYSTPGTVLPSTDTTMSAAFTEFIRLNPNHPVAREKLAGVINGVLKFLVLAPYSTMPLLASQDKLTSVYAEFETFVDARRVGAPAGLLRLEHSTWAWGWMRTQQGLVDGLFNGLGITFPVAFLVLLFATGNILISFFGIVSIGAIVFCVLGWAQYVMGWALGVGECIAGVIVVGFAVDYVVHLGHMFLEAEVHSREERFRHAVLAMGITVVGGAGTTFGAGIIMYLCQMTFFTKMATLISMTIFFSITYALFFFLPLCAIFGPSNTAGDVFWVVRGLVHFVIGALRTGTTCAVAKGEKEGGAVAKGEKEADVDAAQPARTTSVV